MVVLGTIVIVGITLAFGHYNSLLHSGPKALTDGLAIGLLVLTQRRARCVLLLGAVYGLVMLMQIGLPYVAVIMVIAASLAAVGGVMAKRSGMFATAVIVAVVFELLAGFTAPVKILLATSDAREPVLWALWLGEWPLRIVGAVLGVVLARRMLRRTDVAMPSQAPSQVSLPTLAQPRATRSATFAGVVVCAIMIAGLVPMMLHSWLALAILAAAFVVYGLLAGLRSSLVRVLLAMVWGWATFALASYLWHRDVDRVIDLARTLVLRFLPMAIAAAVMVRCVRPVTFVRLLRRLRTPGVILLPLAAVARAIPRAQRQLHAALAECRGKSARSLPGMLLRHPIKTIRSTFVPLTLELTREFKQVHAKSGEAACRGPHSDLAKGLPL